MKCSPCIQSARFIEIPYIKEMKGDHYGLAASFGPDAPSDHMKVVYNDGPRDGELDVMACCVRSDRVFMQQH